MKSVLLPNLPKHVNELENRCLTCDDWDSETSVCSFDACEDCQIAQCDGDCNLPECRYDHENSEITADNWNPDYQWDRGHEIN